MTCFVGNITPKWELSKQKLRLDDLQNVFNLGFPEVPNMQIENDYENLYCATLTAFAKLMKRMDSMKSMNQNTLFVFSHNVVEKIVKSDILKSSSENVQVNALNLLTQILLVHKNCKSVQTSITRFWQRLFEDTKLHAQLQEISKKNALDKCESKVVEIFYEALDSIQS